MSAYDGVRERLARGQTIVLDGPMGSELVRRGIRWRSHGMRTDARAVSALHGEYLQAGANVIRTNTFQLSRRTYLDVFRDVQHMRRIGAPGLETRAADLIRRAVELAVAARNDFDRPNVAIAGVMSPIEHCFRPDLAPPSETARVEHRENAAILAEAGADLILLESMNTAGEALIATEAGRATGRPVWVSFVLGPDGQVLGGDRLSDAARVVLAAGAEAVLVNCVPPEDVAAALRVLRATSGGPIGAFAHVGKFDPPSWKFDFFPQFDEVESWPPQRYAAEAETWLTAGARIVGGCCGTSPAHIQALASIREAVN